MAIVLRRNKDGSRLCIQALNLKEFLLFLALLLRNGELRLLAQLLRVVLHLHAVLKILLSLVRLHALLDRPGEKLRTVEV